MKITTITVKKTRQVKQYEPESLEIVAELSETEDPQECVYQLRRYCGDWLKAKVDGADSLATFDDF